jgi:acyl carrier protein
MIPSRYYLVNHFPVIVNEKMDKIALKDCVFAELFPSSVAKKTDPYSDIKLILSNLLDIEKISGDENLADFGLDSMRSLELILRIEKEFNVKLHLIDIIENYTINQLTQKIQKLR